MKLKSNYLSKRHDLHAHTKYSDGAVSVQESINLRRGYADVIGISDHYRYLISESDKLSKYCDEIIDYKAKSLQKEQASPDVRLGIEVFYADLTYAIKNLVAYPFDFVILENFEYFADQEAVLEGIKNLIKSLESTGRHVEIILAHPNYEVWFGHLSKIGKIGIRGMLEFLREHDICLEFNVNTGYFFSSGDVIAAIENEEDDLVKTLSDSGVDFAIGMDCHAYEEALFKGFDHLYTYFEHKKTTTP